MRRTLLVSLLLVIPLAASAQEPRTPRTPWDTPDLSGYWEYRSTTPLQRPEELAGKAVLTPTEEARMPLILRGARAEERGLQ